MSEIFLIFLVLKLYLSATCGINPDEYMDMNIDSPTREEGQYLQFTCKDGYFLLYKDPIICKDGVLTVNGKPFKNPCKAKSNYCKALPNSNVRNNNVDIIATLACDDGYQYNNKMFTGIDLKCTPDVENVNQGVWKDENLMVYGDVCKPESNYCSQDVNLNKNVIADFPSKRIINSITKVKCADFYTPRLNKINYKNITFRCIKNRRWEYDGYQIINLFCVPKKYVCPEIKINPISESRILTRERSIGSTIRFVCNPGYSRPRNPATCGSTGQW
ncbi:hypothetical protein MHBO_003421 [Bonamia ostreae]|uniref:Sushi domain-containing protein n=1 Tax=Bonamia ostreae TaxID=126728 RepID=A0ABV2AQE3_9EUKA